MFRNVASFVSLASLSFVTLFAGSALATSKDECIEAHGKGQDLRDKGQLARARQTFLTCAQSTCPALVQSDCARMGDELVHIVPTVTFSARDAASMDLPNTSVYVDDTLMATRLDDGRAYEVDPGKHTVRFVHEGKESSIRAVLNSGEKGRVLVATFEGDPRPEPRRETVDIAPPLERTHRSATPLLVAGLGAAAAATGGVFFALGTSKMPSICSTSSRECVTAPNDPAIAKAQDATTMENIGLAVGITGAVALVGGLIWYFVQTPESDSRRAQGFSPTFLF